MSASVDPFAYVRGFWRDISLDGEPVVVGGCERSGTTLLLSVVSSHPNVLAIPYETWGLAWGPKAGLADSHQIRMQRIWRGIGVAPRAGGEDRWAEKSPANIFYFDKILRHFDGRVRCVEIVRDGRDVVTSIHPKEEGPWVSFDRWMNAIEAGLAVSDHPAVYTVRYEDLVRSPVKTMEALYGFLDLPIPGSTEKKRMRWIARWRDRATVHNSANLVNRQVGPIRPSSVRKWKRQGFEFAKRVQRFVARPRARVLLREHGYDLN